jgi:anti-sigma factor RsiW
VTGQVEAAEVFAYVDNCLAPDDRQAFEARLREDPDLRRRVAQWEAQNSAIRVAFGAPASVRSAPDLGGTANENLPVWMASAIQARRSVALARAAGEARADPLRAAPTKSLRIPSVVRSAPRSVGRRMAAIAGLAAVLLVVSAPSGPAPPQSRLMEAGLAAYRAFAATADVPVEFATRDPQALAKWLAPQFARGIDVPRFSSTALTLLGGRIAPGTTASAAFLVYADRGGKRVGLLIEPLDAPAPSGSTWRETDGVSLAAWTDAGAGYAAVGSDSAPMAELMRRIGQTPAPR